MDKKAYKIIEKYSKEYLNYMISLEWDDEFVPDIQQEDREYAKQAGYYFEPKSFTHDELVTGVREVISKIDLTKVANAFIASLSSRNLAYRSALGSYICAFHTPKHSYTETIFQSVCGICGVTANEPFVEHLTYFNYCRYRYGGDNHLDLSYQLFDLTQFINLKPSEPTKEDYQIFREIINIIQNIEDDAKPKDLVKKLKGLIPADNSERAKLIEILGYCGILETEQQKGFLNNYINQDEISVPYHKTDWSYPVSWWRGKDGVNIKNLEKIFGSLI